MIALWLCLAAGADTGDPGAPAADEHARVLTADYDLLGAGFLPLEVVWARLEAFENAHPDLARRVDLTADAEPTWDGNPVWALRISDNVAEREDEPRMAFIATQHAREVIAPLAALAFIDTLLERYGSDERITEVVDANEIWVVPVFNPDGYAWVFDENLNWRKNRRPGELSVGVDLNRNWPFHWDGECGGRPLETSGKYRGPEALSEPESRAWAAEVERAPFSRVLDVHSFGRVVLRGYHCSDHAHDDFLEAEAVAMSRAAGYGGQQRQPSAEGELFEWHRSRGSHAFLLETGVGFREGEGWRAVDADASVAAALWLLERPASVTGHVVDRRTGAAVAAAVLPVPAAPNGELWHAGGDFGRFDMFLPEGPHRFSVIAPGYPQHELRVTVVDGQSAPAEIELIGSACGCAWDGRGVPQGVIAGLVAAAFVRRRRPVATGDARP